MWTSEVYRHHDKMARTKTQRTSLNMKYKLKRCSNKECCKQCRYVIFKGTMTKLPVQTLTHRTTQKLLQHHEATDIYKNFIFVFFGMFVFLFSTFNYLKTFFKKMLIYRLGTVNEKHCVLFDNSPWL